MTDQVFAALPGLPRDADGPVFREPWEAQAFALAVSLQQRGVFSAAEWADALGAEILRAQGAGDPDDGSTYYRQWLAALEGLVATKNVAAPSMLSRYQHAWQHAAQRVPHGQPVELTPSDFT